MSKYSKHISKAFTGTFLVLSLTAGSGAVFAGNESYTLQGTCAFLPADRATEFHGNPDRSKLNLGMAGNQWVVFDKVMQQFNVYIGKGDGTEPAHRPNDATGFTLADLNDNANRYFIELIPPGQIRVQIKSGCMTLGNDEDRNFLPGNFQVDFDVFASTNYNLMQDLANSGFIDEAVPYISNRLDLMVAVGNPKGVGDTVHTGNAEFDTQFDIIMDLLSDDVVASSLDHINEGIHNAANNYMKAAHNWIKANDQTVTMTYTYADGSTETDTKTGSAWIQAALAKVATPMPGSPGADRLVSRDAGENHTSHDLVDNGCGTAGDLLFCEYAVLNKASTHESRVHHVETPNGIVGTAGYVPVDVGFVWITELAYQLNNGNFAVQGMVGKQDISDLGIPRPAGSSVNSDITYSLALLATSRHEKRGRQFIDFLRSPQGQAVYTAGGFTGLTQTQLEAGKCYSRPVGGVSIATDRQGDGSCHDWLKNNH
ncbi:MAG TPA: substrate-binding domain-containing protein [Gammaproteobacteria bacterium]|nr:substrate-binding domain-containing protein [Gammaproteobacteria bacterium]